MKLIAKFIVKKKKKFQQSKLKLQKYEAWDFLSGNFCFRKMCRSKRTGWFLERVKGKKIVLYFKSKNSNVLKL